MKEISYHITEAEDEFFNTSINPDNREIIGSNDSGNSEESNVWIRIINAALSIFSSNWANRHIRITSREKAAIANTNRQAVNQLIATIPTEKRKEAVERLYNSVNTYFNSIGGERLSVWLQIRDDGRRDFADFPTFDKDNGGIIAFYATLSDNAGMRTAHTNQSRAAEMLTNIFAPSLRGESATLPNGTNNDKDKSEEEIKQAETAEIGMAIGTVAIVGIIAYAMGS